MRNTVNGLRIYWAVMKAHPWNVVKVIGSHKVIGSQSVAPLNSGLAAFIPLFDSYEAALKFAGEEDRDRIAQIICQETR
jgi:hypothetical protein